MRRSYSRAIVISATLATVLLTASARRAAADGYTLVGWNNLGMHCMDGDYSVLSLLPPYNTINAQLIDSTGQRVVDPTGLVVTYEAVADPDGSINTTSAGKTNFWSWTPSLFGVTLPVDAGLAGSVMPGAGNLPKPMRWDAAMQWFIAEGIPITPYDDAGHKNPYPLMRLTARTAGGVVLATTDVVLPVSDEMDCRSCHGSGSGPAARPAAGWVNDADGQRDYRLNILRLHDERQAADATFQSALLAMGFDAGGLSATVANQNKAILCAGCHASEALPGSGLGGIKPLTQAIHGRHAGVVDPVSGLTLGSTDDRGACYRCHPGSETRCLRGAMGAAVASDGSLAMQCQSCHGTMAQVAAPTRTGWLDEPGCQNCHTGTATNNAGAIRFTSAFDGTGNLRAPADPIFATNANTPLPGKSLFRFSAGHGGLKCESCHGSTHAEFPSSHRNDNIQSVQHQGHFGTLVECATCHGGQPNTVSGGPHGMHPIGQGWVGSHADAAEGNAAQCRSCHGADYRGTVLSRSQGDRTVTAFGGKRFWRGFQVGCYTCHNGPGSENANPNRAAVVTNVTASTNVDVPVDVTLVARDPDGNPLTLRIVTQPEHGTVGLTGTSAHFIPDAGFTGTEQFTFAAWDGSTDSNLGLATISVGGAVGAGPDLTGTWIRLQQRCRLAGGQNVCRLSGRFQIVNRGTDKAGRSIVRFLLSPDSTVGGDTVLRELAVPAIKPGKAKTKSLSVRLPTGTTATGQYVIAVVDATGLVAETDETNNVRVAGPL